MHQAEPSDSASKSDSNTNVSSDAAAALESEDGAVKRPANSSGQHKKAAHSNIYIRGLAEDVNEDVLVRLVQPFGNIQSIRIYNAKKTLSFGVKCCFAFVKFRTIQEASAAIAGLDGTEFCGNMIQVRFAVRDVESSASAATVQRPPASDNIYCKNLPASLREGELRQVFSAYGSVTSCRILRQGNATGLGGAALVRFVSVEEANCAVESLQGHRFPGSLHPLIIRFADSEEMKERKQASRQGEGLMEGGGAKQPALGRRDALSQQSLDPGVAGASPASAPFKLAAGYSSSPGPLDALPRDAQAGLAAHSQPGSARYSADSGVWHSLAYQPHGLHSSPTRLAGVGMEAREGASDSAALNRASYHPVPADPSESGARAYIHMPMQVSGSPRPSSGFHVGYGPVPHVHAGYMHVPAPMMAAVPPGSYYHQGMMPQQHLHSVPQPWSLPHSSAAVAAQPGGQTHAWTSRGGGAARQETPGLQAAADHHNHMSNLHSVLVGNLPEKGENDDRLYLYECFAPFGAVLSVKLVRDKKGGRQRSGLVTFSDADSAVRAVAGMDNFPTAEGSSLSVSLCKPGSLDDRVRSQ